MRIKVRYFATLREQRGRESEEVEVADGTTIGGLYVALFAAPRVPVAFARNLCSVWKDEVLADGDEVGFLPPLGGG